MNRFIFLFLFGLVSCSAMPKESMGRFPASKNQYLGDDVLMMSRKCTHTIVDMKSGESSVQSGTLLNIGCAIDKGEGRCILYTGDRFPPSKSLGTEWKRVDVINEIFENEGMITTANGPVYNFFLNLPNKKFAFSMNFTTGEERGFSVCSGDFLFKKDANNILSKSKP